MNKENIIEIKDVSVRCGEFYGIKDISLNIKKGSFSAVIGNNGAGKSTLFNAIAGILRPIKGTIEINARDLDAGRPRISIAYLSQNIIVDWYLNVLSNVLLYGILIGMTESSAMVRAEETLKRVGLWDKRYSNVDDISGGQQQRMQLAMIMMGNPVIYLLDEPTTGLDVKITGDFFKFLYEEQQRGKTIVLVSHKMDLVNKYSSEQILMENGMIKSPV